MSGPRSSEERYTPTPWEAVKIEPERWHIEGTVNPDKPYGRDRKHLATVTGPDDRMGQGPRQKAEANAAFIVRAVNTFHVMRAALLAADVALKQCGYEGPAKGKVRRAIAEANAGQPKEAS